MSNNIRMSENELNVKVENEIEWRKMLWRKVEAIEKSQNKSNVSQAKTNTRVSLLGAGCGLLSGGLMTYIINLVATHATK